MKEWTLMKFLAVWQSFVGKDAEYVKQRFDAPSSWYRGPIKSIELRKDSTLVVILAWMAEAHSSIARFGREGGFKRIGSPGHYEFPLSHLVIEEWGSGEGDHTLTLRCKNLSPAVSHYLNIWLDQKNIPEPSESELN
jgi:hypothetical protein